MKFWEKPYAELYEEYLKLATNPLSFDKFITVCGYEGLDWFKRSDAINEV